MAAGSFSIPLRPETPKSVLDVLDLDTAGFGLVCVLAGQVEAGALSVAQITALSRYTGVYRKLADDGLSIEGAGLAVLLGDEDDKGPLSNTASSGVTDRTFKQWVELFPTISTGGYQGLTYSGNIDNPAGNHRVVMKPGVTARTWLDQICLQADCEWRVKNDLSLHAGSITYLYATATTPTVVVTRDSESRDANIRGLRAVISGESDVEDWTSRVEAYYQSGGVDDAAVTSASIGVNPYDAPDGSALVMGRVVDANKTGNATNATSIATNQLAKTDEVRKQINIQIDAYDVGGDISPGDTVYVYDPRLGYTGSTQLPYRGEVIFPTTMRVHAITWPVQQGMGVYLIVGGTNGTVTDLTDWVAFEEGPASLEVGAARRNLLKLQRRGQAAA